MLSLGTVWEYRGPKAGETRQVHMEQLFCLLVSSQSRRAPRPLSLEGGDLCRPPAVTKTAPPAGLWAPATYRRWFSRNCSN